MTNKKNDSEELLGTPRIIYEESVELVEFFNEHKDEFNNSIIKNIHYSLNNNKNEFDVAEIQRKGYPFIHKLTITKNEWKNCLQSILFQLENDDDELEKCIEIKNLISNLK